MRLPRFRHTVLIGAALGFSVPVVSLIYVFTFHEMAGLWIVVIWPSSIMLMATENLGWSAQALGILGMSIGGNVLLYVLIFTFIWSVAWVIRAWLASLRDGTTI